MFARVEAEFVGALVNNAVWARFQPLAELDLETAERMFAVGAQGLFWTMQAAAAQMERRGGGSIVNLSSVSAFHPAKDSVAYSALKAGVVGLSRAAAMELGRAANTNETVEAIRAEGGVAAGMITDASKEENVATIVERCVNELGGLEVFFANIGVTGTNTPLLEQTVEEWAEVYRINTISCFLAIKYAGRHMTAKGYGSIILTSSAASLRANAGAISYSASKAAVNNLAQTAANAFAGTGVRVNRSCPASSKPN
jgi:NAD(P)-dependent dehydrogenase (short-subunit alcohol dehydrogenase family)